MGDAADTIPAGIQVEALVVGLMPSQASCAMSKRRGSLNSDDVVANRVKASAIDLIELIHRENPTGRALSAREAEARYARKARLQSLLVRQFQAELTVVPDPDHPGTVSLQHYGKDACHAVIATLDEDARAWVQLQVDLGTASAPASPGAPRASSRGTARAPAAETPEALVQRAQEEIAAYDYEAARQSLVLAVQGSGGATGPAAALLELLVETLGDDAAALDVEALLSWPALAEPRVRGSLALAAARTGMEDKALALLRGVGDTQTAAVLGALAAAALGRGDVDHAAGHLDRAKKLDPASPALLGIAGEIAQARAAVREPAEAQLAALVAAGRDDEAEKKADELLARWPESEPARRARRTIEERRRRDEVTRFAREADEALAAGAMSLGVGRLRQAAAAARGPEREALERRAREIEAAEQAKREAHQVEEVCRLLAGADEREALLAYLELGETLRAAVRARSPREALTALDATTTAGRAAAQVDAVLALQRARSLLEREPEAALALLGPHAALLERVPEARRISREAEATLRTQRIVQAREALLAARADLATGAAVEALARLEVASLRDLPDEERADAEECIAEATRIVERRRRAEEALRLRAAGRLFEARALAAGEAREAIRAEIRAAYRFEVDDEPQPAKEIGRFRPVPKIIRRSCWWLTADARRIVTAEARDCWVVVRVLHLATSEVHPTVVFRTPEPLGDVHATVCGSTLWLTGERGPLVELSMDGWELVDFRPRADVLGPDDDMEAAALVAGEDPSFSPYLWVSSHPRDAAPRTGRLRVHDLSQRRVVREMDGCYQIDPLAGLPEGRVAVFRPDECTLYTFRGALAPHGRLELGFGVEDVAAHPTGHGLVVCMTSEDDDEGEDEDDEDDEDDDEDDDKDGDKLVVAPISPAGQLGRRCETFGHSGLEYSAASSLGAGLLFVVNCDPSEKGTAPDLSSRRRRRVLAPLGREGGRPGHTGAGRRLADRSCARRP